MPQDIASVQVWFCPFALVPNRKNDPDSGKLSILEFILQIYIVLMN